MEDMRATKAVGLILVFVGIAAAQQPTVNQNGVVNAANYSTSNPRGSLVTIFGTNMASKAGELLLASTTPLSTQVTSGPDTVSVAIDGKLAPIYYATTTQTSILLPWETNTGTATVVVTRSGNASAPQNLHVTTFSPGIFTVSQNGLGLALAFNNATGAYVQPAGSVPGHNTVPAKVGDNLFVYLTGLGPVATEPKDGAAPCPLSGCPANFNIQTVKTNTEPVVMVGGIPATVQFAGLSPQYVGIYQVNFQVPAGVTPGNAVPLQVQIGGTTSSDQVTIAIQADPQ
jgi:uncharacterized protein (TIGR03437 family)